VARLSPHRLTWKGSVDYDEVEGQLLLPYVSEDMKESGTALSPPMRPPSLTRVALHPAACSCAHGRCALAGCGAGYEIKWTVKDAKDESHKKALRYLQKKLPLVKERLQAFTDEIYAK